jgi:hypothetical protein
LDMTEEIEKLGNTVRAATVSEHDEQNEKLIYEPRVLSKADQSRC